jgi:hypothetical protein
LYGRSVGRSVGRSAGWLAGWLVGWLVGWLSGQLMLSLSRHGSDCCHLDGYHGNLHLFRVSAINS